jgi:hypothetical protein
VHDRGMTDLLEKALRTARNLPSDMQDDIARMMLSMAGEDQPVLQLTPEEGQSFAVSLQQAANGEFATDEEVQAVWAKHGL